MKQESPWAKLKGQICLGDEAFLKRMERLAQGKPSTNVARAHTRPTAPTLTQAVLSTYGIKDEKTLRVALSSPSARVFRRGFTCCGGWQICHCGKSQSTAMYHHREYQRSSAQLKRRKSRRRCNNSWISATSRTDPIGCKLQL